VEPEAPDTLRFEEQLPDFEAADTGGRVWRSADLRGKLTVIDIWNTRGVSLDGLIAHRYNQEHPELQRFYEKIKNNPNIQVLTFCTDYDYTHAPIYMKENHFTFPVIADWMLTRKLFGSVGNIMGGVPRRSMERRACPISSNEQWVVNTEGQLSSRFCWWSFGRILMEVERAAQNLTATR